MFLLAILKFFLISILLKKQGKTISDMKISNPFYISFFTYFLIFLYLILSFSIFDSNYFFIFWFFGILLFYFFILSLKYNNVIEVVKQKQVFTFFSQKKDKKKRKEKDFFIIFYLREYPVVSAIIFWGIVSIIIIAWLFFSLNLM